MSFSNLVGKWSPLDQKISLGCRLKFPSPSRQKIPPNGHETEWQSPTPKWTEKPCRVLPLVQCPKGLRIDLVMMPETENNNVGSAL